MASTPINRNDHPAGTRMLVTRVALLGSGAPEHDITIIAWHDDAETFTSCVNVKGGTVAAHSPNDYELIYVLNADGSAKADTPFRPTPQSVPVGTAIRCLLYEKWTTGIVVSWDGPAFMWFVETGDIVAMEHNVSEMVISHTVIPTAQDAFYALRFIVEHEKKSLTRTNKEPKDLTTLLREVKKLGKEQGFNVTISLS